MPDGPPLDPADCDPRVLDPGELRVRQLLCEEEVHPGGEGRLGDWVLENATARYTIRSGSSLFLMAPAGGSVVDAAAPEQRDGLGEWVPLPDGSPFASSRIRADEAGTHVGLVISGMTEAGQPAELRYRLEPDDPVLYIDGADEGILVPLAGAHWRPPLLQAHPDERSAGWTMALWGTTNDPGGWVYTAATTALVAGDGPQVTAARWPDGVAVELESDGEWVHAIDQAGTSLARLPVDAGVVRGTVPPETVQLVAQAPGHLDGAAAELDGPALVGPSGGLWVQAQDDQGRPVALTLWWGDQAFALPPGGGLAPTGPGTSEVWVGAGPGHEAVHIPALEVPEDGTAHLAVTLRRVVPTDVVLARVGQTAWPDPEARVRLIDVLSSGAALGTQFSVTTAENGIAEGDEDVFFDRIQWAELGASLEADAGSVLAWAWAPSPNRAAQGLPDPQGLAPLDLLSVAQRKGQRRTAVDMHWVSAAGPPEDWDPVPDMIRIEGLEDLPMLAGLYDHWQPYGPVGPRTWALGLSPQRWAGTDVERRLIAGAAVAGNGPFVSLTVAGAGPGEQASLDGGAEVRLRVEAPRWMGLEAAQLVGPEAEVLASWTIEDRDSPQLDQVLVLDDPPDWILATVSGPAAHPPLLAEPPWAITGPVWLARP